MVTPVNDGSSPGPIKPTRLGVRTLLGAVGGMAVSLAAIRWGIQWGFVHRSPIGPLFVLAGIYVGLVAICWPVYCLRGAHTPGLSALSTSCLVIFFGPPLLVFLGFVAFFALHLLGIW